VRWIDVEVVRPDAAAPQLQLHGRTAQLAARRGVTRCHLSLTHTAQWAAAVVVLEAA
jgi:holo-[acyl-carrier protein] synthase